MPTFFVVQPNGLLARFSTVVDHFCEVDMTRTDAINWCRSEGMPPADAEVKVGHAERDEPLDDRPCCDQKPLRRWHDCLSTILHVHGTAGLAAFLRDNPGTYGADAPAADVTRLALEKLTTHVQVTAYLEAGVLGKGGPTDVYPDWVYAARDALRHQNEGIPWLPDLLRILGWQGGTVHQALQAVSRLVAASDEAHGVSVADDDGAAD